MGSDATGPSAEVMALEESGQGVGETIPAGPEPGPVMLMANEELVNTAGSAAPAGLRGALDFGAIAAS